MKAETQLCLCLVVLVTVLSGVNPSTSHQSNTKRASGTELFRHTTFTDGSISEALSDFHVQNMWGANALSVVPDPAGGTDKVLRVHYAKGSFSHTHDRDYGAGFYATPIPPRTAMMLSYDVFFQDNFHFVLGGKLPGLWGGAMKSCSGGRHSDDCFTTRFMWRDGARGEVYVYLPPAEQTGSFCNRTDVECFPLKGNSLGRGKWHFKLNQWQNMAQYVHLNDIGQRNGYVKVFVDGQKVYEGRDLVLRTKSSINIDGMYFSTFFGGANSSWATPVDTHTYFKNFVFSTDPDHPTMIG
uniref:Alginate lyase n=1 Tax=Littorina brevicula TaxID=45748 RepID=I4DHB3_9CAEN|nr:alginate lyase [Littorina brevicula]